MPDSNFTTAISDLLSRATSLVSTATAKELYQLTSCVKRIKKTDDATFENAVNTRINSLLSSATLIEKEFLGKSIANMLENTIVSGVYLPSDTGNSGKTLKTNGFSTLWDNAHPSLKTSETGTTNGEVIISGSDIKMYYNGSWRTIGTPQTTFTFDTSKSVINSTYTADNQADINPTANQIAHTEENGLVGKGYFEVKYISGTINYSLIGIASGNFPKGAGEARYNVQGSGYDQSVYLHRDGKLYDGTNNYGSNFFNGNASINDIRMVAYDTTAGKVWLGTNGSWGPNHNPATQAGSSINMNGTTNMRPAFTTQQNGGENYRIEIISHTQGPQYTIPTGFSLA